MLVKLERVTLSQLHKHTDLILQFSCEAAQQLRFVLLCFAASLYWMESEHSVFGSQINSQIDIAGDPSSDSHSKWKRIREYFFHNWWRRNQIFQFKVEDALEALSAQSSELR